MNCETARELILDLEFSGDELAAHLESCEGCRAYLALQRSLDQELAKAYRAPELSAAFRTGIASRVRSDRRKQRWDSLPLLVAPVAGLLTSGICAVVLPDMAAFLLKVGAVLSVLSCIGHLLFVWLTEELGET